MTKAAIAPSKCLFKAKSDFSIATSALAAASFNDNSALAIAASAYTVASLTTNSALTTAASALSANYSAFTLASY